MVSIKKIVCAFTGHRPQRFPWKNNEDNPRCIALKQEIAQYTEKLAKVGVTDFMSGMALGCDLWAARSVMLLEEKYDTVRLHRIIPYRNIENEWPQEKSVKDWHDVLENADSIVYLYKKYYSKCFLDRNHFLVDHADMLFAICKGSSRSGTMSTVNYAKKQGKPVLFLDPLTLNIKFDDPSHFGQIKLSKILLT